jgi:hypothetical protein
MGGTVTAVDRSHRPVMAITKMSIGVPPVNRFTVAARALSKCGRTPAIIAGLMETTMSKNTVHNSKASPEVHELKDQLSEEHLQAVFGGRAGGDKLEYMKVTMSDCLVSQV